MSNKIYVPSSIGQIEVNQLIESYNTAHPVSGGATKTSELTNDGSDGTNSFLSAISTITDLSTTDKTVKGAINEVFQDVNNGKTSLYNAIVDKGTTPASQNFNDLTSAISNITSTLTMGTATSNSTAVNYTPIQEASQSYYEITKTTTFKPKLIIIYDQSLGFYTLFCQSVLKNSSGYDSYCFALNSGNSEHFLTGVLEKVTNTSFTLPVYLANHSYNYIYI